jgi:putative nucleotidyltransferase with HDIG domain
VSLLGLDLVQAVVLASGVFAAFKELTQIGFSVDNLWNHALRTGALAKAMAETIKLPSSISDLANMAGLLHDVGSVLLAAYLPDSYITAIKLANKQNISIYKAETDILGTSHAELGAYLLGLWGLSDPIIMATAYHHQPQAAAINELNPLTFVHIANVLEHAESNILPSRENLTELDWDYVEKLNLSTKIEPWMKMFQDYLI